MVQMSQKGIGMATGHHAYSNQSMALANQYLQKFGSQLCHKKCGGKLGLSSKMDVIK